VLTSYQAYLKVRDDKQETNWLLLDYESDRSDKLKLTSTGSGGLAELKDSLGDSRASYAYVRVKYSNDKESVREKFILVVRDFLSSFARFQKTLLLTPIFVPRW
jgi:hypothetical protein